MWYNSLRNKKEPMEEEKDMRIKEKNSFRNFLKMIFIDVDNTEEEIDITKSNEPSMKELQESLNRIDTFERNFYVSSSSNHKGGKGSSNVVEKVDVDNSKAIKQADRSARAEQQEVKQEQIER